MKLATFAAGCFWGVQAKFDRVPGVVATTAGFAGGTVENPSYEMVCRGDTGHAEAVQVEYDESKVSYRELLELFWEIHDPTSRDRQGPDIGSQYRSIIFFHDPEQQRQALDSLRQRDFSKKHPLPIVTEIRPASRFYRAEDYHQHYLRRKS